MNSLLDTDPFSSLMHHHARSVVETLQAKAGGHGLWISVLTYQELRFGAERRGSRKYHQWIATICERLDSIAPWPPACADRFAVLQASVLQRGTPIGSTDAMIASHAGTVLI